MKTKDPIQGAQEPRGSGGGCNNPLHDNPCHALHFTTELHPKLIAFTPCNVALFYYQSRLSFFLFENAGVCNTLHKTMHADIAGRINSVQLFLYNYRYTNVDDKNNYIFYVRIVFWI